MRVSRQRGAISHTVVGGTSRKTFAVHQRIQHGKPPSTATPNDDLIGRTNTLRNERIDHRQNILTIHHTPLPAKQIPILTAIARRPAIVHIHH